MNKSFLTQKYKIIFGYCGVIFLLIPTILIFFYSYSLNELIIFLYLAIFSIVFGYLLKKISYKIKY